jgi:hypothetical protein
MAEQDETENLEKARESKAVKAQRLKEKLAAARAAKRTLKEQKEQAEDDDEKQEEEIAVSNAGWRNPTGITPKRNESLDEIEERGGSTRRRGSQTSFSF